MMNNTETGNTSNDQNQNQDKRDSCYRDWREDRREMRRAWREERYRRPWHGFSLGLILILLGGLFLSVKQGWIASDIWWEYLLIGLGSISIISGLVHYFTGDSHCGIYWKISWGIILILVGSLFIAGFGQWWPLILIAAGLAALFRCFQAAQRKQTN